MNLGITSYCSITSNGLYVNGDLISEKMDNLSFEEWSLKVYKDFEIGYSKFHKMDDLCKLALLGGEFLLDRGNLLEEVGKDKIAVIIGNASSSIISDTAHQTSIEELPSPAVFVYTLPNIMIGEMCIKYKITGENMCFEMSNFDSEFLHDYLKILFDKEGYKQCITGFVDFDIDGRYEAHLFLVSEYESERTKYQFDKDFSRLTQK